MSQSAIQPPLPTLHTDPSFVPFLWHRNEASTDSRCTGGFVLFIITTGLLLIRPSDLLPALEEWPIYQLMIIGCVAASWSRLWQQLHWTNLLAQPLVSCVLMLLAAVVLSHLSHFYIYGARTGGWEFAKICVYFLLLTALVDTPQRLRTLVISLALFVLVLAIVSLLHYHELLSLPALTTIVQNDISGRGNKIVRLCAIGIFSDPNDLSLVLIVAMGICLYCLSDASNARVRLLWLGALAILGYALLLTYSRGGMLALAAGMLAFFLGRFGWRSAILVAMVALPLGFGFIVVRHTHINLLDPADTAQTRLQLWSESLALFKSEPLFGIGQGEMAERIGQVAHNSFLHAFAEMGFLGGTLFLAAFVLAIGGMHRLRNSDVETDSLLLRLRPYLFAATVAYAAGLMSLSRSYVVPTYLVLGLATVYLRLASAGVQLPRLDARLARRLIACSACFVVGSYLFVRMFVRWD